MTGWSRAGTSRSGAQAGAMLGVVLGGGASIVAQQGPCHRHHRFIHCGPSAPSDLSVRVGVAHWGACEGVGIGPGGCTLSDALRGQG